MKPQDVAVFEEKLSEFAAWKWVFFRACEIDALALEDGFFQGFWLVKKGSLSIVGVGFVKVPPQFYEKGPFYV